MDEREVSERFGELLAAHRRRKRLTQATLAEEADLSVDMVVRLEGGQSGASFRTIAKLATALSVDPVAFFSTDLRAGGLRRPKLDKIVTRLAGENDETLVWLSGVIEAALRSRR